MSGHYQGLTPEQQAYREKLLSIGTMTRRTSSGWNQVKEYSTEESGRVKETRDELGHVVTQHQKGDRQDVTINAPTISVKTSLKEN